jgi:ATP adenylyltransferase
VTPSLPVDMLARSIDGCSFCEELLDAQNITLPAVKGFFQEFRYNKRILIETDGFFVVPSLGALVSGHVLILPKQHYYSVGEMASTDLAQFDMLVQRVQSLLLLVYGSCCSFEHGCVEGVGKAGACIDHAHLHMLPLKTDLRAAIESKFGPGTEIHQLSELGKFVSRQVPYLYYQSPSGWSRAYEARQAPSQFFRQLICATAHITASWDWKADLRVPIVEETYESLQKFLLREPALAKTAGA